MEQYTETIQKIEVGRQDSCSKSDNWSERGGKMIEALQEAFYKLLPNTTWNNDTEIEHTGGLTTDEAWEHMKFICIDGTMRSLAYSGYGEKIIVLLANKPEEEALKYCLTKNFPEDNRPSVHHTDAYLEAVMKNDLYTVRRLQIDFENLKSDLKHGMKPETLKSETGLIEIRKDIMSKFHNYSLLLPGEGENELFIFPIFQKKKEVVGMPEIHPLEIFPKDMIKISQKTMKEKGKELLLILEEQRKELKDFLQNPFKAYGRR
ncbi:MAG: hypothetical protein ACOX0R_02795 [Candidatus Dojkabacteria bacterium]|jgi:hypothetical protein